MKYFLFIVLYFYSYSLQAQYYNFEYKQNKKELFIGMGINAALQTYNLLRPLDPIDEPHEVDINNVWSFDRSAIGQNSIAAEHASDVLMYVSITTPFVTSLLQHQEEQNSVDLILMGFTGFFAQQSINSLSKILAKRPRPYVYAAGVEFFEWRQGKSNRESFYSGHTATSAYLCFFSAKAFTDLNPESSLRPLIYSLAAIIPAGTGYFRYKAGAHFPSDVIVGYLIGGSFGLVIPQIYKNENLDINVAPGNLSFNWRF